MRQFYQTFPEIFATPWRILTWSHYKRLMQVSDETSRNWYLREAAEQMWSYATLNRNISTQYYERMLLSQQSESVKAEMKTLTKGFDNDKLEFIKNPMVTEFLGISPYKSYLESELEKAVLSKLEDFLLELGKGFSFVERQKLVRTEKKDYFIDLVFYNFKLKCFVLIDLKVGKIEHEDVGQMEMYVNMYDELVRDTSDNPTLGIVLCSETDADIARFLLNDKKNVFMSKYLLCLPSQEELRREIERQKEIFLLQHNNGETSTENKIAMDTKKLRQKILDLAIHGKLVPQDPNDEPASVLLERIRAEKETLIKEGKIKRAKKATASGTFS